MAKFLFCIPLRIGAYLIAVLGCSLVSGGFYIALNHYDHSQHPSYLVQSIVFYLAVIATAALFIGSSLLMVGAFHKRHELVAVFIVVSYVSVMVITFKTFALVTMHGVYWFLLVEILLIAVSLYFTTSMLHFYKELKDALEQTEIGDVEGIGDTAHH